MQDTRTQVAFAYADRNADGRVSYEEYRARSARVFHDLDSNGDGRLQVAEQRTVVGSRSGYPSITEEVTLQDFGAALPAQFVRADRKPDGYLSPIEWCGIPRLDRR